MCKNAICKARKCSVFQRNIMLYLSLKLRCPSLLVYAVTAPSVDFGMCLQLSSYSAKSELTLVLRAADQETSRCSLFS